MPVNAVALAVVALALGRLCASTQTPWEAYLSLPTPENAAKVLRIAYSIGDEDEYRPADLDLLRIQVLAGDVEAFRLTYRLLVQADGGLLEELANILGRSIRSEPALFLREVASLRPDEKILEFILSSPGLEYVDRPEAQRYEIEMRRRALAGIKNAELTNIREHCLALMKDDPGI